MDISTLKGKTLKNITHSIEKVLFVTEDNQKFIMKHYQDCCEKVELVDITGDLEDLLNSPILIAEERSNEESIIPYNYSHSSHTWTFYELGTIKGRVTLRWLGESNGYYSESVSFDVFKERD